ncbi:metal-dependent hydrolase [Salinigranum marinum]|uniref:metal-dependent hydrolase n=1 Tax=Salinigranum marinum TaxID=1515595 RepID=UPI002989C715|nr:metal-dependent hydrolase [Salinigranum marinum]
MNKKGHVLNAVLLGVGLGVILTVDPTTRATTDVVVDGLARVVELSVPVTLGALFPDVDTAFGKHRKTLHNLPVLGVFLLFPVFFGNLQFVWIGIATHYLLDVVGSRRGIALFYPLSKTEYNLPTGVTTSHRHADAVTVVITVVELGVLGGIHYLAFPLDAGVSGLQETVMASLASLALLV